MTSRSMLDLKRRRARRLIDGRYLPSHERHNCRQLVDVVACWGRGRTMPETENKFPRARAEKIISRKVQDELIIYDLARDVATCLNSFAADVWDRCDGHSSPAAIAQALSQNGRGAVDERAVWLAVDQLSRSKLLDEPIKIPPSVLGGASRRELLRTLSRGAALAVPAILSIKSPAAAQAATCIGANQPCTPGGTPCCDALPCIGAGGVGFICFST
jgi:hypothetical protein